jgi:hypothetical protein
MESFMAKRKNLGCLSLFSGQQKGFAYEDSYSGAVLAEYVPSGNSFISSFPSTMVSGSLAGEDFWTDGAVLLRRKGKPRRTDVMVKLDRPVENLLTPLCCVQSAFILFHPLLRNCPYVVLVSGRTWDLFDIRYLDYSVKLAGKGKALAFWFNSLFTGVLLMEGSYVHSYISKVNLEKRLQVKTQNLLEKSHALCRD